MIDEIVDVLSWFLNWVRRNVGSTCWQSENVAFEQLVEDCTQRFLET